MTDKVKETIPKTDAEVIIVLGQRLQAKENECKDLEAKLKVARVAIYNALPNMIKACGNSYSNAWCEHFLTIAKMLDCYDGAVIGKLFTEGGLYKTEGEKRENGHYSELEELDKESFNELILEQIERG